MNEPITFPHMGKVAAAAALSGLSEYRIRRLIACGAVRAVWAGKRVLVNLDSLSQYMTAGNQPPPSPNSVRRIEPPGAAAE